MTELLTITDRYDSLLPRLLATASALALSSLCLSIHAIANDETDRPTVWIELGAQFEHANGGDSAFEPPFFSHIPGELTSPSVAEQNWPWSFGPEGKISFQPAGSDWIFSAGVRYGRSKSQRSTQQRTNNHIHDIVRKYQYFYTTPSGYQGSTRRCCVTYGNQHPPNPAFADIQSRHQESHAILDFQAGKDVGLGLFGRDSNSVLSAGVRFAQFHSKMDVTVKARGDVANYNQFTAAFLTQYPQKYLAAERFRAFSLTAESVRSFRGAGPSASWDASATLVGSRDTAEFTIDWGLNAAILFGKQKSTTQHQSSGVAFYQKTSTQHPQGYSSLYNHPRTNHVRSRTVAVPNLGGMAGFSIRFPNARVSMGYRADIFFGAMDAGWDSRESESRSFYGPFATVSIGLGG